MRLIDNKMFTGSSSEELPDNLIKIQAFINKYKDPGLAIAAAFIKDEIVVDGLISETKASAPTELAQKNPLTPRDIFYNDNDNELNYIYDIFAATIVAREDLIQIQTKA